MKHVATLWECGGRVVSLEKPILVGILNVTPDSFSDGGDFIEIGAAVHHGLKMLDAGVSIIDVGGESTRPRAQRVSEEDQIARVVPVIKEIHKKSDVLISIDTTKSAVAIAALGAGASIINDISAGLEDPEIFKVANATDSGIVLMHRRVSPEHDTYSDQYLENPMIGDVVKVVADWLLERVSVAMNNGLSPRTIAIDPGLGYGKSVDQNWQLMEHVDKMVKLGHPVYVGASRKSFIGAVTGIENPRFRDEASAMAALAMAKKGVQIFRVHNVPLHARVLQSHFSNDH